MGLLFEEQSKLFKVEALRFRLTPYSLIKNIIYGSLKHSNILFSLEVVILKELSKYFMKNKSRNNLHLKHCDLILSKILLR